MQTEWEKGQAMKTLKFLGEDKKSEAFVTILFPSIIVIAHFVTAIQNSQHCFSLFFFFFLFQ